MVTLDKKQVEIFKVLEKFRSKDLTRGCITYVYYNAEKKEYIATDSFAMQIIPTGILPDMGASSYVERKDNVLLDAKVEGTFPNYERVIPEFLQQESFYCEIDRKETGKISLLLAKLIREFNTVLNYKYLQILQKKEYQIFASKAGKACSFLQADTKIYTCIMPMKKEY